MTMITLSPAREGGRPRGLVGDTPPHDAFGFGAVYVAYRGEVRCVGVGNPYQGVGELVALANELDVAPDVARELWERNPYDRDESSS